MSQIIKKEKKKKKGDAKSGKGTKKIRKWGRAPHDRSPKDRAKRFRVPPHPPKGGPN